MVNNVDDLGLVYLRVKKVPVYGDRQFDHVT